jgi:hypothetical protein
MISLDSVTFDDDGFIPQGDQDNVRLWLSPAGDQMGLFFYSIPPDLGAGLDDLPGLRSSFRSMVEPAGLGIIEVEPAVVDGCGAVRTIFKAPQEPTGRTYLGSLTLPFADFSFVLKVECPELGMSGQRDTIVMFQHLSKSDVGPNSEGGAQFSWVQDPYDPTHVSAMTMNHSERAEYDELFPDHPLSRARRTLAHLEQTVTLAPEVKNSAPFGG